MATPFNTILTWFETGDFPTQEQFTASWSSFWHKDELIPMNKIENLAQMFQMTVSNEALNYFAKKDASNLTDENASAFRKKLGIVTEINLP